jgi:hypothetical protein
LSPVAAPDVAGVPCGRAQGDERVREIQIERKEEDKEIEGQVK